MDATILFQVSWPNSLSSKGFEENSIYFRLNGDKVYFGFDILFDADEDAWDRGTTVFDKGAFAQCLRELKECGRAALRVADKHSQGSHISFEQKTTGVELYARCGEQGCIYTFPEIPETAWRELGIV